MLLEFIVNFRSTPCPVLTRWLLLTGPKFYLATEEAKSIMCSFSIGTFQLSIPCLRIPTMQKSFIFFIKIRYIEHFWALSGMFLSQFFKLCVYLSLIVRAICKLQVKCLVAIRWILRQTTIPLSFDQGIRAIWEQ